VEPGVEVEPGLEVELSDTVSCRGQSVSREADCPFRVDRVLS
jgi:hypothetical protein